MKVKKKYSNKFNDPTLPNYDPKLKPIKKRIAKDPYMATAQKFFNINSVATYKATIKRLKKQKAKRLKELADRHIYFN